MDKSNKNIRDAMLEIQRIMRQKDLLNSEMNNYFQLLKNLGFPKKIVNNALKKSSKPPYEIESEETLTKQLQDIMERA